MPPWFLCFNLFFCSHIGAYHIAHLQAYESPLAVSVAAGALALPPLLKLASVMERNAQVGKGMLRPMTKELRHP
eukprot:1150199-Pelagomonas_calceolata.AAC.3